MTTWLNVANRAESTLDGGITDVATSMTVVADNFPAVPFNVTIEDEIVKVTEKAALVFTIVREQEGTTGAAHADGMAVRLHLTAAIIQQLQDHEDLTTGVHGAGANTLLHSGSTDVIGGAQLTQVFGAGGGRLLRYVPIPISNYCLALANVGADSPFTAAINAAGSGGLTATNVPYDGDANENMFEGLYPYDGSTYWGQIVLHNTTRGNSRNIVSVDRANNVIVTTSSTDDWADDDALTVNSPTCDAYFDIDLSDFVTTTMAAINISVYLSDVSAGAASGRRIELHPYVTYDAGKKIQSYNSLASQQSFISYIMPVVSQKICLRFVSHTDTFMTYRVSGYWEYADT